MSASGLQLLLCQELVLFRLHVTGYGLDYIETHSSSGIDQPTQIGLCRACGQYCVLLDCSLRVAGFLLTISFICISDNICASAYNARFMDVRMTALRKC